MRLTCIAALVAAMVAATACKPESARRADRAAKDVVEQRQALLKAAKAAKPEAVLAETGDLMRAAREFERQKSRRLAKLHATHDLVLSQDGILMVLASDMMITDAARSEINAKLTKLAAAVEETANLIDGLAHVPIDTWSERDEAVIGAMKRLEDSRSDAWDAVESAPQIDPSAS